MPPPIHGIIETALYVADLERSGRFYETLLGFRPLLADDRMRAYSVADRSVLLLFRKGGSREPSETPGGTIPPHDADGHIHLAFAINPDEVTPWEQWLAQNGIPLESKVRCADGTGGTSLYFRDPDGHAVELITPGCWPIY